MICIHVNTKNLKQFFSYFFVGGFSAIIEWTSFFILAQKLNIYFINATIIAFIISTFSNWIIGRNTTFKDFKNQNRIFNEMVSVYFVSGFGLIINIFIMYLLVEVFLINAMLSKIFGTGIVFIWNFSIRKNLIYTN